ncbi:hypothetical protein JCM15519_19230 [Fundidesulfovibrio butyratiphilus]
MQASISLSPPGRPYPILALAGLVFALWCAHVFFLGPLTMTGDEVRYVAYGLGVAKGEGFHATDETWQAMLEEGHIHGISPSSPAHKGIKIIHSVVYPLLGAYFIDKWQLEGARWLSFAVGAAGLAALLAALRRRFPDPTCLWTLAAIAFACPFLFYLRLFFSEILLFSVNACLVWFLASGRHKDQKTAHLAVFLACLLPFFHLKLSLVSVVVCGLIAFHFHRHRPGAAGLVGLAAIAAAMAGLFLAYNFWLFGAPVGGANPAFKTSLSAIPDRVLVNLFDSRHGLISNAPHLLLALAGFALAVRGRDATLAPMGLVLGAYFFTMLWANGSEAYASRNWTAALPFLAFGFARWAEGSSRAAHALAAPLLALSGCLLCLALKDPGLFLDNRSWSLAYDALYELAPVFHFGYLLPYDFLDHQGAQVGAALPLGTPLFALAALYVLGQALTGRGRAGAGPRLGIGLQAAVLAVIVFFSCVEECPDVAKAFTATDDMRAINVKLPEPERIAFIKIVNPDAVMKQYGYLPMLIGQATRWERVVNRASSIIPVNAFFCADTISIAEPRPARPDRVWMDTATDVKVYRRTLDPWSCPGAS